MMTLNDLRKLPSNRYYVRWSRSIKKDIERGYSINHASGNREAGLSACEIDLTWGDHRLLAQLVEYCYISSGHCWIVTGREVGRGSDNEPLLADVRCVGKFDASPYTRIDWYEVKLQDAVEAARVQLAAATSTMLIDVFGQVLRAAEAELASWQSLTRSR